MAVTIKPGESYGFFTDTSICIGCKACEVACKEWNQLQGDSPKFLADSYDNTGQLDDQNWRHVKFIDQVPAQSVDAGNGKAFLMMSDVCKHCKHASASSPSIQQPERRTSARSATTGCRAVFSPHARRHARRSRSSSVRSRSCSKRLTSGLPPCTRKASRRPSSTAATIRCTEA